MCAEEEGSVDDFRSYVIPQCAIFVGEPFGKVARADLIAMLLGGRGGRLDWR
ncbi:hypothetical protein ABIB48_003013 [Arthrobacter sp. UYCu511]